MNMVKDALVFDTYKSLKDIVKRNIQKERLYKNYYLEKLKSKINQVSSIYLRNEFGESIIINDYNFYYPSADIKIENSAFTLKGISFAVRKSDYTLYYNIKEGKYFSTENTDKSFQNVVNTVTFNKIIEMFLMITIEEIRKFEEEHAEKIFKKIEDEKIDTILLNDDNRQKHLIKYFPIKEHDLANRVCDEEMKIRKDN